MSAKMRNGLRSNAAEPVPASLIAALTQIAAECPCRLEIGRVESLGEAIVDRH